EAEEWRKRSFKRIHQLRQHEAAKRSFACTEALSMKNVLLLRGRAEPAEISNLKSQISNSPISKSQISNTTEACPKIDLGSVNTKSQIPNHTEAYLGIDIGSVSTNLVVTDAAGNLLKEIYLPTQGRPIEVVDRGLKEIQAELG